MSAASPSRVAPGDRRQIGLLNDLITRALGLATGGAPPAVMTTLARHRGLFRRWLWFAGGLMPGGRLPRAEAELVILRVAELTGSEYERDQHVRLARQAGLTAAEIARVADGPGADGWTSRQRVLLTAVDELVADRDLSDATWTALRDELSEVDAIELCLLTGHYVMLAMTLNALRVVPDAAPGEPPAAARLLERVARRGR